MDATSRLSSKGQPGDLPARCVSYLFGLEAGDRPALTLDTGWSAPQRPRGHGRPPGSARALIGDCGLHATHVFPEADGFSLVRQGAQSTPMSLPLALDSANVLVTVCPHQSMSRPGRAAAHLTRMQLRPAIVADSGDAWQLEWCCVCLSLGRPRSSSVL